jgi:hypothetical protein
MAAGTARNSDQNALFWLKMPIFWRKRVKNFHFYAFETGMVQPEVSISIFQNDIYEVSFYGS